MEVPRAPRRSTAFYGEHSTAALFIAVCSGVLLATAYDVEQPRSSVALILLLNPGASFFRNVHYWSTQVFLVLSLLHVWDHLRQGTPRRMRAGAWLRVCLGLPALGLLAWSGFVLKGDTESLQALRVVSTTLGTIPLVGAPTVELLFGRGERLHLLYVHHAATLTLFVWIVALEHGRFVWPRLRPVALVGAVTGLVSLWWSPALHDGVSAIVKGPWYFVGLQEAFHWSPWPAAVLAGACVPLLLVCAVRWTSGRATRVLVRALLVVVAAYAAVTAVAWACRGANWTWDPDAWRTQPSPFVRGWIFSSGAARARSGLGDARVPAVMERPEGCLVCHAGVTGLSKSHDPATLGCASCHLGNALSLDADVAHRGMRLVPGNLADAMLTCGADCHGSTVTRVTRSLMTTMSGVVIGNRVAWGEPARGPAHVTQAGLSGADSHFRHLCASCHLGAVKTEPGPVTEAARGGGCTACHVTYDAAAREDWRRYTRERSAGMTARPPTRHPNVALPSTNLPCFGCHSRSGRISLSYEGWHEADPAPPAGTASRTLEDERVVYQRSADAHWTKGMTCVDCHTSREVMGDGRVHERALDQMRVACEDCHRAGGPRTRSRRDADDESRRILRLRASTTGEGPVVVAASGDVLTGAALDANGVPALFLKSDGRRLELRPPAAACADAVHGRVACIACHTAWAPRCLGCHTRYDPSAEGYDLLDDRASKGDWIERGSDVTAGPPTLGVRRSTVDGRPRDVVEPTVPGMIATLDAGVSGRPVFRRFFARLFPHTVTKGGLRCRECHLDPVVLGFGRGRLALEPVGQRLSRWTFTPAHPRADADNLPADAWVAFLGERRDRASTRDDVFPLPVDVQQRVLGAGACLTCHDDASVAMRSALKDWKGTLARMTSRCRQVDWSGRFTAAVVTNGPTPASLGMGNRLSRRFPVSGFQSPNAQ